jgi:hypothetical protein
VEEQVRDNWKALNAWLAHVEDVLAEWERVREESFHRVYP